MRQKPFDVEQRFPGRITSTDKEVERSNSSENQIYLTLLTNLENNS